MTDARVRRQYPVQVTIPEELRAEWLGKEHTFGVVDFHGTWSVRVQLEKPFPESGRGRGTMGFLVAEAPPLEVGQSLAVRQGERTVLAMVVEEPSPVRARRALIKGTD